MAGRRRGGKNGSTCYAGQQICEYTAIGRAQEGGKGFSLNEQYKRGSAFISGKEVTHICVPVEAP